MAVSTVQVRTMVLLSTLKASCKESGTWDSHYTKKQWMEFADTEELRLYPLEGDQSFRVRPQRQAKILLVILILILAEAKIRTDNECDANDLGFEIALEFLPESLNRWIYALNNCTDILWKSYFEKETAIYTSKSIRERSERFNYDGKAWNAKLYHLPCKNHIILWSGKNSKLICITRKVYDDLKSKHHAEIRTTPRLHRPQIQRMIKDLKVLQAIASCSDCKTNCPLLIVPGSSVTRQSGDCFKVDRKSRSLVNDYLGSGGGK